MSICIDKLIEEYKKYIINDKIINYYNFNFEIITNNIDKFESFLSAHNKYNNNTFSYFNINISILTSKKNNHFKKQI